MQIYLSEYSIAELYLNDGISIWSLSFYLKITGIPLFENTKFLFEVQLFNFLVRFLKKNDLPLASE